MERRDKINYYLDLAEMVSQRGTCLRKQYGAVIVKNDEVVSTGYVGAPRGRANCIDLGYFQREYHAWRVRRARRKFEVYMRKRNSPRDPWVQ